MSASLLRRAASLTGALLMILTVILAGTAASAPTAFAEPPQSSLEEVLDRLGVDKLPADYVVLIDTSGSMQDDKGPDLYQSAREGLAPLLDALDDKDRLTLINFDSLAQIDFSGPLNGAGSKALQNLPDRATGTSTDIGAAIKSAIDALGRAGDDPAIVIMLTDGDHSPPPGSQYVKDTAQWVPGLRSEAQAVTERRPLRSYALALADDQKKGAQLFGEIFGHTEVLNLPADQVKPYLYHVKDQVRLDKAAAVLQGERLAVQATLPGEVTVGAEGSEITAELTSLAERVPLHVSGLTLRVGGASGRAVAPDVDLPPKGKATVRFKLTAPQTFRWRIGVQEEVVRGAARLSGTVESPWLSVLARDIRVPFSPPAVKAEARSRAVSMVGIPYWQIALALLALVLMVLLGRYLTQRRWVTMNGEQLTVSPQSAYPEDFRLAGRRMRLPYQSRSEGPAGQVEVRAQRRRRIGRPGTERVLYLWYRRDGRTAHAQLHPGRSVILLDDTEFAYVDRSSQ
ncbi:vWA domain-containing protein [Sphaerimonospora cavernae]|uniref:VWA domain-containing protein n=1 Tax=Sphaerimonospora cavernae TaxID=1740611 RepID=A0ABV6U8X2_9ACTN